MKKPPAAKKAAPKKAPKSAEELREKAKRKLDEAFQWPVPSRADVKKAIRAAEAAREAEVVERCAKIIDFHGTYGAVTDQFRPCDILSTGATETLIAAIRSGAKL